MKNIHYILHIWNYISRNKCSKITEPEINPMFPACSKWPMAQALCLLRFLELNHSIKFKVPGYENSSLSVQKLLDLNLNSEDATAQASWSVFPKDLSSVMAVRFCVCTISNLIKMVQTESKCHTHCEMNSKSGFWWQLQARRDTVNEWCEITAEPFITSLPATSKLCQDRLQRIQSPLIYTIRMHYTNRQTVNTCGAANIPGLAYKCMSNSDT